MLTKTITIKRRVVYYKIAEIDIQVPDIIMNQDISRYLAENQENWVDDLNMQLNKEDYQRGFGLGDGMVEGNPTYPNVETIYEVHGQNYRGRMKNIYI